MWRILKVEHSTSYQLAIIVRQLALLPDNATFRSWLSTTLMEHSHPRSIPPILRGNFIGGNIGGFENMPGTEVVYNCCFASLAINLRKRIEHHRCTFRNDGNDGGCYLK
uniref:Uncharacterized protein n=1 Tax=Parascaris univalens TaxID=6257 RepID=A0A915AAU5_PARUN